MSLNRQQKRQFMEREILLVVVGAVSVKRRLYAENERKKIFL